MDRRSFLAAFPLLLSGCMPKSSALSVGSKNFTEQLVLGELLAQYLGRFTTAPIDRRFYLAGTYICHQALLAGRIDMYVEYTGTALVAILKEKPVSDHAAVYNTVKDLYSRRFGLQVFPSLGFDNTFAMVMRGNDARRLHLKTLSAAAAISSQLRLGVGYEFIERPDGYKGLAARYGFKFAEAPRVMDLGLLYRALQNNQVDMVAGSNTDGLIAALDLVVLEDDRHYFPPYDALPIVRRAMLERHPEVATALEKLSGRITADDMRHMNYAVDGEKKDAALVVKAFLAQKLSLS
ncbi:MAG TPA: glycine betaine ABC transporter substrate-binding protein [Candidatus Angelobacter sp.]